MKHTISPAVMQPDLALYGDIVYGNYIHDFKHENISLKMHIMHPYYDRANMEKTPLLVYLSGGAWRTCTPLSFLPRLAYYARHGYAVASVQYRVSSQAVFPAQVQDVKEAIRFLRCHADEYYIDPDRIAVMGDSAGGHLALLSALSKGEPAFASKHWGQADDSVSAVVCVYGAVDFSPDFCGGLTKIERSFPFTLLLNGTPEEKPELAKLASPSSFITKDAPPVMLLHGTADRQIPFDRSEAIYKRLTDAGVDTEFLVLDNGEHGDIRFAQPEVQELVLGFLNKHMRGGV